MKSLNLLLLSALIITTLSLTGCASKAKKSSDAAPTQLTQVNEQESGNEATKGFQLNGDSDSGAAGGLETIYFPYRSSTLTSETRAALEKNSALLKEATTVEIQVEGHCDERGGVQYNLALGAKRAEAVKNYLISLGVNSKRITTISFGKERPVTFGHDEESWSKNRRANFVITAK